ncbi:hypothetical protein LTR17_009556 [Elasticomyces elasticus]|nr:hypothetical protein LTR17_009556 [Elasticomyces elasticus]
MASADDETLSLLNDSVWEHSIELEILDPGQHSNAHLGPPSILSRVSSFESSNSVQPPSNDSVPLLEELFALRIELEEAKMAQQPARFADKLSLCLWFPEADPDQQRAKTFSAWWSRRKTVLVNASITAALVCLVNAVGTTHLCGRYPDSRLFQGDCLYAARLNTVIHVLINILSILLLGASNFSMQLL